MNTGKNDPYLTAKIVRSYLSHNRVETNQISGLITTVHRAIGQLGQLPEPEEVRIPAVSVRRSVHHDYVVCLDCGYRGKTLRRHISTRHGLDRDEYLKRWGLRSDHPLTAPAYSERRSTLAKALGLGRRPKAEVPPAVTPTAAPTPVVDQGSQVMPTRRRRSRAASEPADVASQVVAEPMPPRRRRSRSTSKSLTADVANEAVAATPARKRRPRSRASSPQPEQTSSSTAET